MIGMTMLATTGLLGAYLGNPRLPRSYAATSCGTANDTTSLNLAINVFNTQSVSGCDTVTLTGDFTVDPNGISPIDGTTPLTIDGAGHVVTGYVGGGGIQADLDGALLTVKDVTFTTFTGAPILETTNDTDVTITNSTFTKGEVGALRVSGGDVTISDSVFDDNGSGGFFAGAIELGQVTSAAITHSTFTANGGVGFATMIIRDPLSAAVPTTIDDSYFANNTGFYGGGGLTTSGAPIEVTGSTFADNTAAYGSGGAIETSGDLTLVNSTLTGNTATGSGGAIRASLAAAVDVQFSTLSGNSSPSGNEIFSASGEVTLTNSIVTGAASGADFGVNAPTTASLTIVKDGTVSSWDPSFGFTAAGTGLAGGSDTFSLGVGDTKDYTVTPADGGSTYTVTEDVANLPTPPTGESGYKLTAVSCVKNGDTANPIVGDTGTGEVQVSLSVGDAAVCTYTNQRLPKLTVVKHAINPDNLPDSTEFDLTTTGLSPSTFKLGNGGKRAFTSLTPGDSFAVTEAAVANWTLTSLECYGTGAGALTASVANAQISGDLDYGDEVVCTYVNTTAPTGGAFLYVRKDTTPVGSTTTFDFTAVDGGSFSESFQLVDGAAVGYGLSPNIATGTAYTVTEAAETGWSVSELDCVASSDPTNVVSGNTATRAVSITLLPGDVGVCVFDNAEVPAPPAAPAAAAGPVAPLRSGFTASHSSLRQGTYYDGTSTTPFATDGVDGNQVGQDPLLGALGDNGGFLVAGSTTQRIPTMLPGATSPVIDAGVAGGSDPKTDQRGTGFVRSYGTTVDMGAVEVQPAGDGVTVTPYKQFRTIKYGSKVPKFKFKATVGDPPVKFYGPWTTRPTCGVDLLGSADAGHHGPVLDVGSYDVVCSGGVAAGGESVSYVDGTLTVVPAAAPKVYPLAAAWVAGQTPAALGYRAKGFKNGESFATSGMTAPTCSLVDADGVPVTADTSTPAGVYYNRCSGAATTGNYASPVRYGKDALVRVWALVTPTATGMRPSYGYARGGTKVHIYGSGFLPGTTVEVGGVPCTRVVVQRYGAEVDCYTGAHAPGVVDVVVTTPGGTVTLTGAYRYK